MPVTAPEKYHINDKNEVKPCTATRRPCHFAVHYTPEELVKAIIDNPALSKSIGKKLKETHQDINKFNSTEKLAHQKVLASATNLPLKKIKEAFTVEAINANTHRIYDWLKEQGTDEDSWSRELSFQYATGMTGRNYDVYYNAWLNGEPLIHPNAVVKRQIVQVADAYSGAFPAEIISVNSKEKTAIARVLEEDGGENKYADVQPIHLVFNDDLWKNDHNEDGRIIHPDSAFWTNLDNGWNY